MDPGRPGPNSADIYEIDESFTTTNEFGQLVSHIVQKFVNESASLTSVVELKNPFLHMAGNMYLITIEKRDAFYCTFTRCAISKDDFYKNPLPNFYTKLSLVYHYFLQFLQV